MDVTLLSLYSVAFKIDSSLRYLSLKATLYRLIVHLGTEYGNEVINDKLTGSH